MIKDRMGNVFTQKTVIKVKPLSELPDKYNIKW